MGLSISVSLMIFPHSFFVASPALAPLSVGAKIPLYQWVSFRTVGYECLTTFDILFVGDGFQMVWIYAWGVMAQVV